MRNSMTPRVPFHLDPEPGGEKDAEKVLRAERILETMWETHGSRWTSITELEYQTFQVRKDPDDHMSKVGLLLADMEFDLWKPDMHLHLEKEKIGVHSAVVGAHSNFLRQIISESPPPPLSVRLSSLSLTVKGLQDSVNFMYSGRLPIFSDRLPSLLQAATSLQIPDMKEKLKNYMLDVGRKNIHYQLFCLQLSILYPISDNLKEALSQLCAKNLARIGRSKEFLLISLECLIAILTEETELREKDKFHLVLEWLRSNKEEIGKVDQILDFIDFQGMTRREQVECEEAGRQAAFHQGIDIRFAMRHRNVEANWAKGYEELMDTPGLTPSVYFLCPPPPSKDTTEDHSSEEERTTDSALSTSLSPPSPFSSASTQRLPEDSTPKWISLRRNNPTTDTDTDTPNTFRPGFKHLLITLEHQKNKDKDEKENTHL